MFLTDVSFVPLFSFIAFPFKSENVNVTSLKINPLAYMNIEWTDEMVADLRTYESGIKAVFPGCWRKNLTTVAVSINVLFLFLRLDFRRSLPNSGW